MTQIAVIGPGALGCLFAARFAHAGFSVCLVDYDAERACLLDRQGIYVDQEGGAIAARPQVSVQPPDAPALTLMLTKAHATSLAAIPPEGPVLTLQNGLGNAEILARRCGKDRVYAGATSEAVTWLAPGRVRHAARGKTVFGTWGDGDSTPILKLLQQAGFDAALTTVPEQVVWEKAAVNAAINPLTALFNVRNGALLQNPQCREVMACLVAETRAVAQSQGMSLPKDMYDRVEHICAATRENCSSMLQDIHHGKQTEIEAISGEIMRRGEAGAVPVPCTRMIYRLIRALESRS